MIRPGGRGQWFVLVMFQRANMRQPEQYKNKCKNQSLKQDSIDLFRAINIKAQYFVEVKEIYLHQYVSLSGEGESLYMHITRGLEGVVSLSLSQNK